MDRIIRIKTDKNFTIIPNIVFQSELSLRAIGLLTYILHLPDDWVLYKTYLYQNLPCDGRDAIKTAWQQLEEKGFIIVEKTKSKGRGKLPETNYLVYDFPQKKSDFPSTEIPQSKDQHSNIRPSKTSTLLNTNLVSTKKTKTKKTKTNSSFAPSNDDALKSNLYKEFINVYDEWFKSFNEGVPPNYNGANCNAAKSLILYFKKIVNEKAKSNDIVLTEEQEALKVVDSWKLVLSKWSLIDSFLQTKTRLIDINSNIQNIITQLKNGTKPGASKQPITNSGLANSIAEMYREGS